MQSSTPVSVSLDNARVLPSQNANITMPGCAPPKPVSPALSFSSALAPGRGGGNVHRSQNGCRQPSCMFVLVKSPLNAWPASEVPFPTSPASAVLLVPSVMLLNDTLGLKPNIRFVVEPSQVMS